MEYLWWRICYCWNVSSKVLKYLKFPLKLPNPQTLEQKSLAQYPTARDILKHIAEQNNWRKQKLMTNHVDSDCADYTTAAQYI